MTQVLRVPSQLSMDEETLWRAAESRDTSMIGVFVIAVSSTGIYCRPGCPARMPKRENVRFFAGCDEAEAAGFRACKRCKPRDKFEDDSADMVRQACAMLDADSDDPPGLATVSRTLGVSTARLQRMFRRTLGITPGEYADARRLERLKRGLRNGRSVTESLYAAGYGSSSRLYESADRTLGMTPATYRRRGDGMSIRYTIVDSQLGRLLVGATERGVCSVKMGDRDEDLEAILIKEYPAAQIERFSADAPGALSDWAEALIQHIATGEPSVDLPLDIRVTAFQGRVYQALRTIANGQTRSYGDIAKEIGRPKAVRAVANACADNPVALTVPCHRIIRGNGDLGGYGGGVHRKRELLEREARAAMSKASG